MKKILTYVLALATMFVFAACGSRANGTRDIPAECCADTVEVVEVADTLAVAADEVAVDDTVAPDGAAETVEIAPEE